ncbi:MAG: serine/threonine-protein kinase [Kofleriaceae bacterium]
MSTIIGRPEDRPGQAAEVKLGKYVLDAPLGMGGMAEVFRAHTVGAEGFARPVAIKRVLPDASRNPAFAEMFISEAKLSSRMQHPNIVAVLDFDRDHEGRLYLVMELVEGKDLDGIIESGPLPYPIVIYTVVEVLRGLGYAHELPPDADGVRGLVHRDVSPHNVLCGWSGAVKVSDFGIAKARAATAASASVTIKGKPAYMSPEQINGSPLDGRSDLFAVGVMLWQMLTGQYLFASGTTAETLARVLFSNVVPPRQINPQIPADLEAVTLRLLEKDPAARFQTADEAIDALLGCADAPRDGRRDLERLLLERFPGKAPNRTGSRTRSELAAPASGAPGPVLPPASYSPTQQAVMRAPTQTAGAPAAAPTASSPPPARRGLLLAAVAAALVAAVVVVVVLAGGDRAAPAAPAATPPPAVDAGAPLDAAPPDAPPPIDAGPAIDATPPVDAGLPVDAGRRKHGGGTGSGSSSIQVIKIPGE